MRLRRWAGRRDVVMCPAFPGVGLLDDQPSSDLWRTQCSGVTRRSSAAKCLTLIAAGRPVAQVAADLDISARVIYTRRKQHPIDTRQIPGITSRDQAALVAATADRGAGGRPPSRWAV